MTAGNMIAQNVFLPPHCLPNHSSTLEVSVFFLKGNRQTFTSVSFVFCCLEVIVPFYKFSKLKLLLGFVGEGLARIAVFKKINLKSSEFCF